VAKRKPISKALRRGIYQRDGYRCVYCGKHRDDGAALSLDHIRLHVLTGNDWPWNLLTACVPCNQDRGGDALANYCFKIGMPKGSAKRLRMQARKNLQRLVLVALGKTRDAALERSEGT
jgi:hypothetical protein